jgi:hypothetical protein
MKHSLLLVAVVALFAVASPAHSQYMYLDTNNDGVCDSNDILSPSSTSVDVWIDTNHNANGSVATCSQSSNNLTINSYEVIMRATGSVTYGTWTDNMSFATNLGDAQAGGDFYAGRGSGTVLPAGLYKVGSVAISGVSAGATLSIVSSTSASPIAETAFGSLCEGGDFDNTMKLGSDWFDVCGSASGTPVTQTTWGQIKNIYK